MKKRLIQLTQPLLNRLGLRLRREKDDQRLQDSNALLSEIVNHAREKATSGKHMGITFIVFSKDRALQLDGLLQSILHHVFGSYSIKVIYSTSSDSHRNAYNEVADRIKHSNRIEWTEEKDFRTNLIEALDAVETESVCFLVDDIVFIRPVHLDTISQQFKDAGILSLRLGRNITFCYTKQKTMQKPGLSPAHDTNDLLQFSWEDGNYDWAYPLSVDGHIFPVSEIRIAAKRLDYHAPNSFERALQILTPLYQKRPGFCFESPRILNIPFNRVQNENNNICGEVTPEELLNIWNDGGRLDYRALENIATTSVHTLTTLPLKKA